MVILILSFMVGSWDIMAHKVFDVCSKWGGMDWCMMSFHTHKIVTVGSYMSIRHTDKPEYMICHFIVVCNLGLLDH